MKRISRLIVVLALLLAHTGVAMADKTEFFTGWGADMETILGMEPEPPVDELTQDGMRILVFERNLGGQPGQVWYGFDKNKLYACVYSVHLAGQQFDAVLAGKLKTAFDDDIIAALDRPRYMIRDAVDYLAEPNQCSWFRDDRTLALGAAMIDTEALYYGYTASFLDAGHREGKPWLKLFDDFWQGTRTEVPFILKKDLQKE